MKIKLLTLSLLLTASASAQITVNSSNFFSIGDSYTLSESSVLTPNDAPGTNKTWNYSTIDTNTWNEYYTYVLPSSTSNGASFPTSNIAEKDSHGEVLYYEKTSSQLNLVGVDDGDLLKLKNPLTYFSFPLSYGVSYSDIFEVSYTDVGPGGIGDPDSTRTTISGTKNQKVDSWGALTIPTGTFDALRIKDTMYFKYVEEELHSGTWSVTDVENDTSISNIFVTNHASSIIELLTQELDQNGNVEYLTWNSTATTVVGLYENNSSLKFSIYPNPVQNTLNINSSTKFNEYIITNILGEEIRTKKNISSSSIDISTLESGQYILTLKNKEGFTNRKFVKQ